MIKRTLIITMASLAVSTSQAQWAVFDAANFAQAVQQVAAWQEQLQGMAQQYQQQLAQFKALTGARGFGDVLSNPLLQKYLPLDMQQMYNGVKTGNMSQVASAARQQQLIYDCMKETNPQTLALCRQQLDAPYAVKDMFQTAYATASEHFKRISELQSKISLTQDPKGIAELQARIQTEQVTAQTAMNQAQIAAKLAEVETKLVEQQVHERTLKDVSGRSYLPSKTIRFDQ